MFHRQVLWDQIYETYEIFLKERNTATYYDSIRTKRISMATKKIRVSLFDLPGPVIIIPAKTGIIYQNQTCGCACHQDEAEGYLYPVSATSTDTPFNPDVWYERGCPKINFPLPKRLEILKDLDIRDEWLREMAWKRWVISLHRFIPGVEIEDGLQKEAWVKISFPDPTDKTKRLVGILTWVNCD